MHRDGYPFYNMLKKKHIFLKKLLTRVTVADKLVLVNPF